VVEVRKYCVVSERVSDIGRFAVSLASNFSFVQRFGGAPVTFDSQTASSLTVKVIHTV